MIERPKRLNNRTVELRPEADAAGMAHYQFSPVHLIRWVQCPRCRRRFWYAVYDDTPSEELYYWGNVLRQRLLGEPCGSHPGVADAGS